MIQQIRKTATASLSYPLAFLLVVCGYFVSAWCGALLSLPPSNASPIWPAAGVATAALFAGGLRLWPAIIAGYIVFQLVPGSSVSATVDPLTAIANGTVLGAGAALQAIVGAWVVRRQRRGLAAAGGRTVLRTMLLAGPVACLISATWSIIYLVSSNIVPSGTLTANWLMWWVGDSIGVLLFAPLAFMLLPAGRMLWSGRALQTAVPLVATAALLSSCIYWFNSNEASAAREPLVVQAELAYESYNERLSIASNSVQSTANLFSSSEFVSDSQFGLFARGALNDGLLALGWISRVTDAERSAIESQAKFGRYPDFRIRERNSAGQFVPAGVRDVYFPVLYLESATGTNRTLGLDIRSEPSRMTAFLQARDSGLPIATRPLPLLGIRTPGVVLLVPVYERGNDPSSMSVDERRLKFRGAVAGVLDPTAVLAGMAHPSANSVVGYVISDETSGSDPIGILGDRASAVTDPDTLWQRDIAFHGRNWNQQARVVGSYWQPGQNARSRIFMLAMLLCALLISTQTLTASVTHRAVSQKVAARTREMAANRRKYLAALRGSRVGCWELDVVNRQMIADDTYLQLLGTSVEQENGNRFPIDSWVKRFTYPSDVVAFNTILDKLACGDTTAIRSPLEFRAVRADGEIRHIVANFDFVYSPDGKLTRLVGGNQDITGRKQNEIALRDSEEYSRRILQSSDDCIKVLALDGTVLDITERGVELLGAESRESMLGFDWMTTWTRAEDIAARDAAFEQARSGVTGRFQGRASTLTGIEKFWENAITPISDANGKVERLLCVTRDISEEQAVKKELRRLNTDLEQEIQRRNTQLASSERELRETFSVAAVGISHVKLDGNTLRVNPKLCEITGYAAKELTALPYAALSHSADTTAAKTSLDSLISGEAATATNEKRYIRKDGSLVWVRESCSLVNDVDGTARYLVVITEDISAARAERETRIASEKRFRATFEMAALGIAHVNRGDGFIAANPRLCEITGYSEQELLQMESRQLNLPGESEPMQLRRQRLWNKEISSFNVEKQYLRKDGSKFWVNVTVSPVLGADDEIDYTMAIVEDISWRKEAEAELRRQQSLNRLLLETLSEGVVACDANGELMMLNRVAREWHGCDLSAIATDERAKYFSLCQSDGTTPLETESIPLMRAYRGEVVKNFEMSIVKKGHPPRLVLASGAPLTDSEGTSHGAVVVMHDITDRLRSERAAREALATLDATKDGAYIFDPQTLRFSYVNEGAVQQLGYSREELIGMTVEDVAPEFSNDIMREALQPLISGEKSSLYLSTVERRKDGREIPVGVNMQYVAPAGEVPRCIGIVRDATESKQALDKLEFAASELRTANATIEQERASLAQRVAVRTSELTAANTELAGAKEAAESASRAKSSFLAVMSHEIRTPMNGIVGMVDVLAQSALSDSQKDAVRTIQDSSFALMRIIDDVLDFSKIEAGKLQLDVATTALADLVESVCDSLTPDAIMRNVDLHLFVDPALPVNVAADPTRLRQLLYNLIGNAIKFSSNCGREGLVQIRVERGTKDPGSVTFQVIDNGIGIAPELVPALFSSFTQAEASTTRRFGGTGLGLAITQRLVELMDGEIEVISEQNSGSTFAVSVPLIPSKEQPADSAVDLQGLQCVLIDGNNMAVDTLETYLDHAGITVRRTQDIPPPRNVRSSSRQPVIVVQHIGRTTVTESEVADICSSSPGQCVLLVSSLQRQPVEVIAPNSVMLHAGVLRRNDFLRAVAVAAGRQSPDNCSRSTEDLFRGQLIAPSVAQARADGRLILVAEDDPVNQKVILMQLGLLGYAGELAANGTEAFEMWQKYDYALLLTDLHMPETDGYQLLAKIRKSENGRRHMPAIALTANALRGVAEHARVEGFDAFLTKPALLSELGATLRDWVPTHVNAAFDAGTQTIEALPQRSSLIDPTVLATIVGTDPNLLQDVYNEYLDSTRTLFSELRDAVADQNAPQVARLAHRQKGSALAIGAAQLSDLCAEVENAARANNPGLSLQLVERLERHSASVDFELQERLQTSLSDSGSHSASFLRRPAKASATDDEFDSRDSV